MLVKANAEIEFLKDCNWPIDTLVLATKTVPGTTPNARKDDRRPLNLTTQFHRTKDWWKEAQRKDPD